SEAASPTLGRRGAPAPLRPRAAVRSRCTGRWPRTPAAARCPGKWRSPARRRAAPPPCVSLAGLSLTFERGRQSTGGALAAAAVRRDAVDQPPAGPNHVARVGRWTGGRDSAIRCPHRYSSVERIGRTLTPQRRVLAAAQQDDSHGLHHRHRIATGTALDEVARGAHLGSEDLSVEAGVPLDIPHPHERLRACGVAREDRIEGKAAIRADRWNGRVGTVGAHRNSGKGEGADLLAVDRLTRRARGQRQKRDLKPDSHPRRSRASKRLAIQKHPLDYSSTHSYAMG